MKAEKPPMSCASAIQSSYTILIQSASGAPSEISRERKKSGASQTDAHLKSSSSFKKKS